MEIVPIIIIFVIFGIILFSYSREKADFVSISLLGTIIAVLIVNLSVPTTFEEFLTYVEFKAILLLLGMQIITHIAREAHVLEYFAISLLRLSKGNQRALFYVICISTTLLAAIIADVVVALILAPIVIRICRYLKLKAGTYLLGMTIVINIGSIITPFSSGENIIISEYFQLNTTYFITYYWLFSFLLLFLTIFLIDFFLLRKEPIEEAEQRAFIMEILNPSMVITDRKQFLLTSIIFIGTIVSFVFISEMYIVALISATILVLITNKQGERPIREIFKEINWEVIFFFMSLMIFIGCMQIIGVFEIFQLQELQQYNVFIVSLIILILVSVISGILANTPTMLVFLPIVDSLINVYNFSSVPLIFALLVAVNLGGNILPQGAMCDVVTLKTAQQNQVINFSFRRLLIVGAIFAGIHILCSALFLFVLSIFFG